MLSAQQRLPSAMIAAGLGVFSSQTMVDLYSAIYDTTDPGDLPDSDAWQLRQAFVGKDADDPARGHPQAARHRQGRSAKEAARASSHARRPWSCPMPSSPRTRRT